MPFMFENLEVYQKAVAFAQEIGNLTESFTKGNYYLTDHLNRVALSVATNIVEGNGRHGQCILMETQIRKPWRQHGII